jgi:hypothetical protein
MSFLASMELRDCAWASSRRWIATCIGAIILAMRILCLLLILVRAASACAFPVGGDVTIAPNFAIRFERDGKPLAGVNVAIWKGNKSVATVSGTDGAARFFNVPTGRYSLGARVLGMPVASAGFQVAAQALQRDWVLSWKEPAVEVRTISGKLLWGDQVVRLAEMKLTSLASRKAVQVYTNNWGLFRFDSVQDAGDYVLYSEGGDASGHGPMSFGRTMLVRLSPTAKQESISIGMEFTSCGGRMFLEK